MGFVGHFEVSTASLVAQPPPHARLGLQILFDGHVANITALETLLPFSGASDTVGVIAAAYRRWGFDYPRHVIGEYSAIVYDPERQLLMAASDSLGLYPLFYATEDKRLSFAVYLQDLLSHTKTSDLDEEYIADFLATGQHTGERTPYRNISRVLAGEVLIWNRGVMRRSSPWRWKDVREQSGISLEQAAASLKDLLKDAVNVALPESGKVWCELSGGLDSSTVTCFAARLRSRNTEALTITYPQTIDADESYWARKVLRQAQIRWNRLDGDRESPFSALPRDFTPEPSESILVEGLQRAYRDMAADSGVSRILSGSGGDAVLLGEGAEPYYFAQRLLAGNWASLWRDSRSWANDSQERRSQTYWLRRFAGAPAWRHLCGRSIVAPATPLPTWLEPAYVHRHDLRRRRSEPRRDVLRLAPGAQFYASGVAASAQSVRTGYRHQREPFEFRFPLLHRPLVEFMHSLPWRVKLCAGEIRAVHREALRGVVPESVRMRTDKQDPSRTYVEGLARSPEWISMLTSQPRLVDRGYVKRQEWDDVVKRACFGVVPSLRDFLCHITLEVWLQQLETSVKVAGQPSVVPPNADLPGAGLRQTRGGSFYVARSSETALMNEARGV